MFINFPTVCNQNFTKTPLKRNHLAERMIAQLHTNVSLRKSTKTACYESGDNTN